MTMLPLGDLAQSLMLRRSVTSTQMAVNHALRDLSTGQAGDPAAHLRGQTAPLSAIDATLARNTALSESLDLAGTRASVMQAALSQIDEAVSNAAQAMVTAAQTSNPSVLRLASGSAMDALKMTVAALNQTAFGQSVFSGNATDQPAIAPVEEILLSARAAMAGAVSPADASRRLDDWFAAPDGFESLVSTASADPFTVPIGPDQSLSFSVTTRDPAFHSTIKGLLLGSLMADADFAISTPAMAETASVAARILYASSPERAETTSRLGLTEARIAQTSTRITAENGALRIARNDFLSVDGFETATRLTEAETRLEQLYAITARLSRLSLAEYMR